MKSKLLKKIILINLILILSVVSFILAEGYISKSKTDDTKATEIAVTKTEDVTSAPTQPEQPEIIAETTTPVPAPAVKDDRCIVTVRGNKYNVTEFKKKHDGGDIFACGTDMTAAFNKQHDSEILDKVKSYLIN